MNCLGRPLIIVILVLLCVPAYALSGTNIRVCVAQDKDKILLRVKGPYRIEALNSDIALEEAKSLRKQYVLPTTSGMAIGEKEYKVYGIRVIPKNDAAIYVEKVRLRGIVDIIRTKRRKLLVVNHLDIEKYLYGVLYHEMPHYWPMETLKAQAIAARTFAMQRVETMRERDYDVTSDIYSQVYGGRSSERRTTRKAVDATRGKVLTYNGKILPAYYHAICGGHTESAEVVFGIDLAPLRGRRAPYCKGARGMRWKASFSYKQMEEKLNKYGIKVKGLSFIAEGKRDRSGRLIDVVIRDAEGVKRIKGFKFRLALSPNTIKSTNFTMKITTKGIIFRGKGWGHGVGMCQWGAFGMGKRRFNYKRILDFYYPGAKIESIRF